MHRLRLVLAAAFVPALCSCSRLQAPAKSVQPSVRDIHAPSPTGPIIPRFVDVAESAGLRTVLFCGGPDKDHILESVGTGCAFIDCDGDGLLDVYLVNAWALDEKPSRVRFKGRNALYRNRGD